jgi:hypothetical protein
MAVSKRLRYEVLRRDDYACRYCGARAPEATLTVDHVLPTALGGEDKAENLVAACSACNGGKAASNPDAELVASVSDDALRWASAMREAAWLERAQREHDHEFVTQFGLSWATGFPAENAQYNFWLDDNWKSSILRFRDAGLNLEDLDAALKVVDERGLPNGSCWRYFCGVCWGVIRQRQDVARDIIAREDGDA